MPKISAMMDVGKRSLMNSQTALQTVAHNIANKDVEGASRQRVEFQSNLPIGEGRLRIGMGAKAASVTRVNNPFLEKQIQNERGKLGFSEGRSNSLAKVENVFNEQMGKGLNQFVGEFFNAFRQLSNNPESIATRTLVRETAAAVSRDFGRVSRQLKDIQADIDNQITSEISEINAMAEEIARLNESIEGVELAGVTANDERDRRDQVLKDLGEKINIRFNEGDRGQVVVSVGSSGVLVSGFETNKLFVAPAKEHGNKRAGNVDVTLQISHNGPATRITEQIKGGRLGGALEIRDVVINEILEKMDRLAYNLSGNVNKIHRMGADGYGRTGNNFFKGLDAVRDSSENLVLADPIAKDAKHIAAGMTPGAPGDNRIANRIAALQLEKVMDEGAGTYDDFFNGVIGELAVEARQANSLTEHQGNIVNQLKKVRESVSGVSLDEEATKMVEFQKTFDASARLIRTADEMLETVLNIKR